ncbi:hypothetical protein [Xenococcus sp. PCC 7305]|nr:hypothetical protein [Xenococcus sp. PCC 7305]
MPTQRQLMLKTIESIYKDGRIQLTELPQDVTVRRTQLLKRRF